MAEYEMRDKTYIRGSKVRPRGSRTDDGNYFANRWYTRLPIRMPVTMPPPISTSVWPIRSRSVVWPAEPAARRLMAAAWRPTC